jgi:hypothetical protein
MKVTTIKQALQQVADNPHMDTDDLLNVKVHELVSRALFEIANGAQLRERGSMNRANVARNMIFTRLIGRRRAGSHPATNTKVKLDFVNLTGEEIEK